MGSGVGVGVGVGVGSDFFSHKAFMVMFFAGMVPGIDRLQPLKVYPVFVGSAGALILEPYSCVIGAILLPPSVSKVMV